MVAVFIAATLLTFVPHVPVPTYVVRPFAHTTVAAPATQGLVVRSPIAPMQLAAVHARAAPRCPPAQAAATPLQLFGVITGLAVFGGLPFILAGLQPKKSDVPPSPPSDPGPQ